MRLGINSQSGYRFYQLLNPNGDWSVVSFYLEDSGEIRTVKNTDIDVIQSC
jgi:hypothetical protein